MDLELLHHLEERIERLVEEGLDPEEARREAERRFGNVDEIRQDVRAVGRGAVPGRLLTTVIEEVGRDVRVAIRSARRSPWFAAAVVATLAVGIGVNVAIFSVVEAVLLRPLPFPEADRIVWVHEVFPPPRSQIFSVSPANYLDWHERQEAFESMAAVRTGGTVVAGDGDPERVPSARVSSEYFRVFGMQPFMGRTFASSEEGRDPPKVVVVSHGFWASRLGKDPDAIGRAVRLDGEPHTVIGVTPPEFGTFRGPYGRIYRVELWLPAPIADDLRGERDARMLAVVARLDDGVDLERADAEMRGLAQALAVEHPVWNEGWSAGVYPLSRAMTEGARAPLAVLFGAVAFVLLITCLNVGNLLLVRIEARRGSVAQRRALGASRARVVMQLLTESLLLSLAGSAGGIVLAGISLPMLVAASPMRFVRMEEIGLNAAVLAFAIGVALLTTVMTGLVPALRASAWNLADEMKRGGLVAVTPRPERGRAALVVMEVALSVVLVVAAGLMARSYQGLTDVDLGFEPDEVVNVSVALPRDRYAEPVGVGSGPDTEGQVLWRRRGEVLELFERVERSMSRIPGVTSAAAAQRSPLPGPYGRTFLWPADAPRPANPDGDDFASFRPVRADWFEAVGIPLVRGRSFHQEETAGSENVVVLDEQTAAAFWPGRNPLGRSVVLRDGVADTLRRFEVVGVAGNVRQEVVDFTGRMREGVDRAVYVPYRQQAEAFVEREIDTRLRAAFAVRTSRDLRNLAPRLREAVWAVDPELPVTVERVTDIAGQALSDRRFYSGMLGAFGALGLLLAATGVFVVMSYSVSRKTREFGLRMALGARVADLERSELARGLRLAVLGIAIGGLGAAWFSRFLSGFLYGVGPLDPMAYGTAAVLLGAATLLAAYVPTRLAARVDPVESLRVD